MPTNLIIFPKYLNMRSSITNLHEHTAERSAAGPTSRGSMPGPSTAHTLTPPPPLGCSQDYIHSIKMFWLDISGSLLCIFDWTLKKLERWMKSWKQSLWDHFYLLINLRRINPTQFEICHLFVGKYRISNCRTGMWKVFCLWHQPWMNTFSLVTFLHDETRCCRE